MTFKRVAVMALALALVAVLAVGLAQTGSRGGGQPSKLTLAQMQSRLRGSPGPLAALHAQAGEVLGGEGKALHARLAQLHGYPVVVNKWASWCGPCRGEFGAFQRASVRFGRQVAFLGLDSGEADRVNATAFLRSFPVSYPSYYDPSGNLGQQVTDSAFTPVTVFIARDGRRYIHQGPYPDAAKLERDVQRYALDA